jgi:hypothetical protein
VKGRKVRQADGRRKVVGSASYLFHFKTFALFYFWSSVPLYSPAKPFCHYLRGAFTQLSSFFPLPDALIYGRLFFRLEIAESTLPPVAPLRCTRHPCLRVTQLRCAMMDP